MAYSVKPKKPMLRRKRCLTDPSSIRGYKETLNISQQTSTLHECTGMSVRTPQLCRSATLIPRTVVVRIWSARDHIGSISWPSKEQLPAPKPWQVLTCPRPCARRLCQQISHCYAGTSTDTRPCLVETRKAVMLHKVVLLTLLLAGFCMHRHVSSEPQSSHAAS